MRFAIKNRYRRHILKLPSKSRQTATDQVGRSNHDDRLSRRRQESLRSGRHCAQSGLAHPALDGLLPGEGGGGHSRVLPPANLGGPPQDAIHRQVQLQVSGKVPAELRLLSRRLPPQSAQRSPDAAGVGREGSTEAVHAGEDIRKVGQVGIWRTVLRRNDSVKL